MRYILLASLALSDCLCLIFINSFRIASFAYENWLYGDTMCQLDAFLARYFYLNTVLHLVAISYERYDAIVKSPLTLRWHNDQMESVVDISPVSFSDSTPRCTVFSV